jgi:hypothetical protein
VTLQLEAVLRRKMLVAIDWPVPLAVHFAWNNAFRKLDDPADVKIP